jgi:hypothetical protein
MAENTKAAGGWHPQSARKNQPQHHNTDHPVETLLGRLDGVRQTAPDRWVARCPAHDDRSPSLGVRETDDGRVLLRCWAGCDTAVVLATVGLEFRDLYPCDLHGRDFDSFRRHRRPPRFRAAEVVELVTREACVCALALSDVLAGEPISAEDTERIVRAIETIFAVGREVEHGL